MYEEAINFINKIHEWFWEVKQHRLKEEFPLEQSAMPPSVFAQVLTFGILPSSVKIRRCQNVRYPSVIRCLCQG